MIKTIKYYEDYVETLESLIFDNVAIKLATYRGFYEAINQEFYNTKESFPLLFFVVESLQVDCVMTISKLVENRGEGKTVHRFINFVNANIVKLQKKYPALTNQLIQNNLTSLKNIELQVENITKQRDKYYAHADNLYFFDSKKLLEDFPDTQTDLVEIIQELQNIIQKHRYLIKGKWRVCMSDFAYLNTSKTVELLKDANEVWLRKYRPDE